MATFQNDAVPKYRENDIPKTVKDLRNYTFNLSEQMMFLFSNLDEDNVPELEDIKKRLTDAEGNITNIVIDATGIAAQVKDNEDNIASLQLTAQGLAASITTAEGDIASLKLTADSLDSRIMNSEGDISALQQTASSLKSQIGDANANISNLQQTATGLTSRVSSAENNISTIKQTANSLEISVSDLDGKYTSLKQTVDGFDFTGLVTFNDLSDELDYYPTKKSLANGRTSIDGGCIDTGLIDVDYIELYGEMEVLKRRGGTSGGFIGYCSGNSDTGVGVMEDSDTGQCICTNGGAKLAYGADDYYLGVSRSNIFASEDIYIESDRRVKEDIRYDLDTYEDFYRKLKPCSFLRKRRTSGRRHTGFIAQEVEEALRMGGKTTMDLAALGYDPDARRYEDNEQTPETAGQGCYKIRYTELIALNTAMIQKLMTRVDELEQEIAALKGGTQNNGIHDL